MKESRLRQRLNKLVEAYLDVNVGTPALETMRKDFHAQNKLADMLTLLRVTIDCIKEYGLDFDKDYLKQLSKKEIEERINVLVAFIETCHLNEKTSEILRLDSSRKYLLAYVSRELNWVVISILSASYVSANILMRSVFELLIGMATRKTGSMSERINGIFFLSPEEKTKTHGLWADLCSWSHPYGKWLKEVCPVFVSRTPMYHPYLCKQSLDKLERIVDLFLALAIEKFEIRKVDILQKVKQYKVDISDLALFRCRH